MVRGDSKEKVLIFRDRQTDRHLIIIYISSPILTFSSYRRTLGLAKYPSFFPHHHQYYWYLHHYRQGLIVHVQIISSLTSLAQIINISRKTLQSSHNPHPDNHLRHSLQLGFVVIVQSFHKVSIHWGASRSSILQGVVACLLFLNINVHVFMLALHVHENKHIANQESR